MKIHKLLEKLGWPMIFILSFLPAIIWLFQLPITLRFSSLDNTTTSLGQLAGLIGMAMFAVVLILSARLKFYEKFFSGMNETYIAHHNLGALSFCILLFHPIILAYSYLATSFQAFLVFIIPSTEYIAKTYGTIAIVLMIVPLFITFYVKLRYHVWKFTHKFLGVAFIFAFLHTFLIGSDIAVNPILKYYLFSLSIIAIVAYGYRTIFGKFFVKEYKYIVKSNKLVGDKTWEIEFEAEGKGMEYQPGQFVFLKIFNDNLSKEAHPFSISSGIGENLKIAIKELGDYTKNIGLVKSGNTALIEGPYGKFSFKNFGEKQIWIAGGIGITPFLSMLRVLNKMDKYQIDLYYSCINEKFFCFTEELKKIESENKNIKINFWDTEKNGLLSPDYIIKNTNNAELSDILICGPGGMMTALKNGFFKRGIKKNKIITEDFKFYK